MMGRVRKFLADKLFGYSDRRMAVGLEDMMNGFGLKFTLEGRSLTRRMLSTCGHLDHIEENNQSTERALEALINPDCDVVELGWPAVFARYNCETHVLQLIMEAGSSEPVAEELVTVESVAGTIHSTRAALKIMRRLRSNDVSVNYIGVTLTDDGSDGVNLVARFGGSVMTTTVKTNPGPGLFDEVNIINDLIANFEKIIGNLDDPEDMLASAWPCSWPISISYAKPQGLLTVRHDRSDKELTHHECKYRVSRQILGRALKRAIQLLEDWQR